MIGKRTKYINQMAVKCIKEAIKDEQFTLEPIDILSLKRIRIDKCEFVLLGDGTFYFYNDEGVTNEYITMWRDDVGGVLRNDIKKKKFDKYYEITTYGTKTLVRKVDEEEDGDIVLRFKSDNMIKLGDFLYLPIKIIEKSGSYWIDSASYNNVIEVEVDESEEAKKSLDDDLGFDDDYEDYRMSKEDEDIENYYIPKEEY